MIPRRNKIGNKEIWSRVLGYFFSKGKKHTDYISMFEEEVKSYLGVKHAALTPTGRKGLTLILDYYAFPKGSEILLPAYTLKDLVFLIKGMGYIPVFVDIDARTYNIDASLIENKITGKTRMIIATHIFGVPCEIDKIMELARKHNLIVMEDCAHALGATYKGKCVGSFGDAAFFSLETSKPINTFGGGITVTNDQGLSEYIKGKILGYPQPKKELLIKVCSSMLEDAVIHSFLFAFLAFLFYSKWTKIVITKIYLAFSKQVNVNDFAYANFQAYLGVLQLRQLDSKNKSMMEKIYKMRQLFQKQVSCQEGLGRSSCAFYYNIIKTEKSAEEMRKRLLFRGVDVGIKDEITDNCPAYFNSNEAFPVANDCFEHLLQLPMTCKFNDEKAERIVRKVEESLGH